MTMNNEFVWILKEVFVRYSKLHFSCTVEGNYEKSHRDHSNTKAEF